MIVINEGKFIYDGALRDLVSGAANKRSIKLRLERKISTEEIESLRDGESDLHSDGFTLSIAVPRNQVAAPVAQLLRVLPVEDLTLEDVEIESVIRDLFLQSSL